MMFKGFPALRSGLGALAAALLLLGGAARAQTRDSLKVGYLPVTGQAKFFVAQEYGLFAKEGLDVELIEFQNSADGLAALRGGKLDLGAFGTTAPLVHIAKGADLRIIGGIMGEDAAIVTTVANAGLVKGVKDLKGRKVATVRLATGDAVLRGALEQAGLDWRRDLEIFELKSPPAVMEAVKSGQVFAGVIWGPHDLRAEQEGLRVVIRSKDLDPALLEKGYYSDYLDQASDPNVKGVSAFWATMQASEFIDSKQAIRPFIDTSVYKKALDGLAREFPRDPYWKGLEKVFAQRDV
jgi:NitT/TauT family transport system substrate-binding protein